MNADKSVPGGAGIPKDLNDLLQLLLDCINRELNVAGFTNPLCMRDLDSMDSDTFVKILTYVLTVENLFTMQQLKKSDVLAVLPDSQSRIEYDATLDNIYWAVKSLLPDDDEIFTYGLLFDPKSHSTMAKQVLIYLVQFNLLADNYTEAFMDIKESLIEENERRIQIHKEIDEVKEKITCAEKDRAERKEMLPQMQEKLKEVHIDLAQKEDELVELELEVQKWKTVFTEAEEKKGKLEKKLLEEIKEVQNLENQLIPNPGQYFAENNDEKTKLEAVIAARKVVGEALSQLSSQDTKMGDLIHKSECILPRVYERVNTMMEIEELLIEHSQKEDQTQQLENEFRMLLNHFKDIKSSKVGMAEVTNSELQKSERNYKSCVNELERECKKAKDLVEKVSCLKPTQDDLKYKIEELNGEIGELSEIKELHQKKLKDIHLEKAQLEQDYHNLKTSAKAKLHNFKFKFDL